MIIDKKILLIAPLPQDHIADGYSNAALGMLHVLESMKENKLIKDVNAINLNSIQTITMPLINFDIIILIINPFFIQTVLQQTQLKNILNKGKQVFLQMVWETTPMPQSWKWIWTSDLFSGFIAPSKFIYQLISSNTKKSVFYIPHFVDVKKFPKINLEEKIKEKNFTVLSIGQWTKRKGNEDAIIAYSRSLLSEQDNCKLIVKYNFINKSEIDVENQIRYLVKTNSFNLRSPIYTNDQNILFDELLNLYKSTSILLFPSRGEGFGLPVAECMSIGIPIIYTGWSSTVEVSKAPGNIPIKYVLDEAIGMSQFGYERGLKYAIPLISDLIDALNYKYFLWSKDKKAYYEETQNNYKIIEEKYGMQAVTNQFIEMFKAT